MRRHVGWVLLAGACAVWVAIPGSAQSPPSPSPSSGPAPCAVAPQPVPCGTSPATATKSTAQKFPFPGEPSDTKSAGPSLNGVPDAPDTSGTTPAAPAVKKSADFPFPGEPSKDASSSSSSSSSNDDGLPVDPTSPDANPGAAPGLKDKGSEGSNATPGRHILHRVNPVGTKLLSPDEREAEDLDIAHYYTQTGDIQGAYLRSQDAVKLAPDDPDAHFALAEAALKLNKRDEAIAEYNACLKHDPTDKQAKEAHKALARLKP